MFIPYALLLWLFVLKLKAQIYIMTTRVSVWPLKKMTEITLLNNLYDMKPYILLPF